MDEELISTNEMRYTNCPFCGAEYTYAATSEETPIHCGLCGNEFMPA
jgi:transcription elongation factor Elf1